MADYNRNSYPVLVPSVAAGVAGAVVGGTISTAKTLVQIKRGELEKNRAPKVILNESVGTGIAVASASTIIRTMGLGGSLVGLAGFCGITVGTKYLWDSFTAPEPADVKEAKVVDSVDDAEIQSTKETGPVSDASTKPQDIKKKKSTKDGEK